MARLVFLLAVFFFLGQAQADVCNAGCSAGGSKDGFQAGSVYNYNLEGKTQITLSGADRQETGVSLTADVQVYGLGNCANILKVKSVRITGPDGAAINVDSGNIGKAVRFTLENGKIQSEICAEAQDSIPSLNIKRAIISMLQTGEAQEMEYDVFGRCPTTVSSSKSGGGVTVTKIRDLNSCLHREQGKHDVLSAMNYGSQTPSNILDSSLKVEAFVKSGVVDKVESTENYLYVPFSVDSAGAKAFVTSKLTLKGTGKGAVPAKTVQSRSIIFENPHPISSEHSSVSEIQTAMKTVTQNLEKHVDVKSASIFSGFIKVLRVSSKNDLQTVFNQIKSGSTQKDNSLSRKVFLDGLFRAGTGDSVETTINLIKNKELSSFEQKLAIYWLASVVHVTSDSIKAATGLLDVAGLPNEVYLGVGTLAGVYCRSHPCHGASTQDANIAALSSKLASKIGNCKANTRDAENMIMFALKAVRNIRHIEDSLVDKLANCAGDKTVHPRVRVAALEAYSADPCISKLQTTALSIMKDINQDSELRIQSYLAVINCPSTKVADELKELLKTEKINQVGSFVTSSLRNIKASTNPSRDLAKKYFDNIDTGNRFPIDARKFSTNFELSYEHAMFGIGSYADANVIYSQNSFLPRSASLNLTAEIFGRSLNLIEVGFRQGNLDRLVEEYFGPHGEFNVHTPQQIYNHVKNRGLEVMDKIKARMEKIRGKRSIIQATSEFGKNLKTDILPYIGDLDFDFFVRIFGSDAVFLSLGENEDHILDKLIDRFFDAIDSGVTDAKDISHEIRNHLLLMEVEAGYPTSLGVALKLNIEASSTSKIQFSSKIDFRQIFKDPKNSQIDLKIVPSANLELAGIISFDADVLTTGLKVATTLHTSTGSHVVAKVSDNGRSFDMRIGLPVEKQELITVAHEIQFVNIRKGHLAVDQEVKFSGSNSFGGYGGCFDQLSSSIGLVFCGDIVSWAPSKNTQTSNTGYGPLRGPAKFFLRTENADNLKGFHVTGKYNDKNENQKTFDVMLETEGTKNARKVTFGTDLINKPELKSFKMKFDSSIKKLEFEGTLVNDNKEKSVMTKLLHDKDEYLAKIGVTITGARNQQIFKPMLDIKTGGNSIAKAVEFQGTILKETTNDGEKYTSKGLSIKTQGHNIELEGWWKSAPNMFQADIALKEDKQKATLAGKWNLESKKMSTNWDFHNTINENVDFSLNYVILFDEKVKSSEFSLVHGPDFKSKENKISYYEKLKTEDITSLQTLNVEHELKFSYPLWNAKTSSSFEIKPKRFYGKFDGEYGKSKAELIAEFQHGMKKEKDFISKMKIKINENGFDSDMKFDQVEDRKGKFNYKLTVYPNEKHEANGDVMYQFEPNNLNAGFNVNYKTSVKPNEYHFNSELVNNPKMTNALTKFTVGSVVYVDVFYKAKKEAGPTAEMKMFIKDFVNGQGSFKVNPKDHKGNVLVTLELLKTKKMMKVDGNFMVANPQYNANIDFYADFNKDKSKKMTFTTNSKVQKESIDSKSSITLPDQKIDYAVKGDFAGSFWNGKVNGQMSLSHSNGKVFTWKLEREIKSDKKSCDFHADSLMTYVHEKSGKPFKFIAKTKGIKNENMDIEYQFTFVKSTGEEADYKFLAKRNKNKDRINGEGRMEISGALAPNTISAHVNFDHNDKLNEHGGDVKYRVKGSCGPKTSVDASGTLFFQANKDEDVKMKSDLDMALTFPMEKAQNVKFVHHWDAFVPKDKSGFEFKNNMNTLVNTDNYNYESHYKFHKDEKKGTGFAKMMAKVPNHNKLTFDSNFNLENMEGDKNRVVGTANVEYGDKQTIKVDFDNTRTPGKQGHFKSTVQLPSKFKDAQKITTDYSYNRPNENSWLSQTMVDIDGKKYSFDSNIDFTAKNNPVIEFKGVCPNAKPYRLYIRGNALDKNAVEGAMKIENFGEFNLDMNVNAKVQSPDEFVIKAYIDCAKMKLNKVQIDASSESLNKGAKKVKLSASENGKNIIDGSSTYQTRYEGAKFIMEGTGSYKIKDQTKSTTFKYIRDKISTPNELGDDITFSVGVGDMSGIVEYKMTNLESKLYSTYCEAKKECAHINIFRKFEGSIESQITENFDLSVDLRKLGFVPEFGLSTATTLEKMRLPVYQFNMHLNLDKSKYHTQIYAKPSSPNYITAFTVTMPQRVISLESTTTYPDLKAKSIWFPFKHEVIYFMNKNDASTKSMFKYQVDKKHLPNKEISWTGEILLASPALSKNMEVSGRAVIDLKSHTGTLNAVLDIFKKKQQKITINGGFKQDVVKDSAKLTNILNIDAKTLGFELQLYDNTFLSDKELTYESKAVFTMDNKKREASASVILNPKKQKIFARLPSTELINLDGGVNTAKSGIIQLEHTLSLLQGKVQVFSTELHSSPYYGFKFSRKEQGKQNEFIVTGKVELSKLAEFRADYVEGKNKKPLLILSTKIVDDKIQPENSLNTENIKYVFKIFSDNLRECVKETERINEQLKENAVKDVKRVVELLKEGELDRAPIQAYFTNEFEKIRSELENDKALQKYVKEIKERSSTILKIAADFLQKAITMTDAAVKSASEIAAKISKAFNDHFLPEFSEFYRKTSAAVFTMLQVLVDLFTQYVAIASTMLEKIMIELKPLFDSLQSVFNDAAKIVNSKLTEAMKNMENFCKEMREQFESMPLIIFIKEKIDDMKVPENIINQVTFISDNIKSLLPSEKMQVFVDKVTNYIIKKVKKEPCDDFEEIRNIFNAYMEAVEGVRTYLKTQLHTVDDISWLQFFGNPQIGFNRFRSFPKPTPPAFSLYNYITKGKLPTSADEEIRKYRSSYGLIPPYQLHGIISGGQHIFTYDGRHLTFPGNCKYVISQDAVDGNFSIVINLAKGSPKSIILTDKSGSEVEVSNTGKLSFNGAAHGFPLVKSDTLAWKKERTFTIMTKYGAKVKCNFNLDLCFFDISGFYMGKLRGLLGDGNNEPFDDFRLPNGQISSSEGDFGNAYGLGSCPKVKTVDHSDHHGHHGHHDSHDDVCEKFFGDKSRLSPCKFIVDIGNYKQACQHATMGMTGENAEKEACMITKAYKLACDKALPFRFLLPDECAKCEIDGASYKQGEVFKVKTPQKKADIVLAIETTTENKKTYNELIVPLMAQIIDNLKGKKVDDVKVHLVGISPNLKYPIFYDIDDNKLHGAKIDFKDQQRSASWESPITTENEKVNEGLNNIARMLQRAQMELGLTNLRFTYSRISRIQFRPKAMKTVIMVHSMPCSSPVIQLGHQLSLAIMKYFATAQGVVSHLITPIDIKSGKVSNIIGFSDQHVFVAGDKHRGLSNSNLRAGLTYGEDSCLNYALQSYGNVYSSSAFNNFNAGQKKGYIALAANTISDSLTSVNMEYECKCTTSVMNFKPVVDCNTQSRKDNRKPINKKK